jgi:hypothetical protein
MMPGRRPESDPVERHSAANADDELRFDPNQVLERVAEMGDLFRALLEPEQRG